MRKRQRGNRAKLNMALLGMVTALVMVGMASYAWFTLSTNPEIKGMNFSVSGDLAIQVSTDGEDFATSKPLFEEEPDYAPLVPVSTVDGLNWFVCKYDTDGNVLQNKHATFGNQFVYYRFPEGGNVAKPTQVQPVGEESSPSEESVRSYYLYKDIYLRTQEDEVDVYLSIPSDLSTYADRADETEKKHYGSYVMSFHKNEDNQLTLMEGGSETSARVGMMVIGKDYTDVKPEDTVVSTSKDYPFYIYEPNADRRSEADKAADIYEADKYISGFTAKNFGFATQNGKYIQTYPIALDGESSTKVTAALTDSNGKKNENVTTKEKDGWADGTISLFETDRLCVQMAGTWVKPAAPEGSEGSEGSEGGSENQPVTPPATEGGSENQPSAQAEGEDQDPAQDPNPTPDPAPEGTTETRDITKFDSTWISTMGQFLNAGKLYEDISTTLTNSNSDYIAKDVSNSNIEKSLRSSAKITTLKKNEVQKIRIYFWLEGQDVDCWNDIADTDFLVNLEFVGEVK